MTAILQNLSDNQGAKRTSKRLGRGIGSGKGKTCGRGGKGQTARKGVAINGFEGGQTPIHRRLPKRGFNNFSVKTYEIVNLGRIQQFIEAKSIDASKTLDIKALIASGLITGKGAIDGIKLLGSGEFKTKINIVVNAASKSAIAAVEKAGGKVEVVKFERRRKEAEPKKEAAAPKAKSEKKAPAKPKTIKSKE
jgi:large subunit ribosomal protein L15